MERTADHDRSALQARRKHPARRAQDARLADAPPADARGPAGRSTDAAPDFRGASEPGVNGRDDGQLAPAALACRRSEEHTSELPSLMRNSYAVFCLNTKP